MWPKLFKQPASPQSTLPLFDEPFLRRLERLNFRTAPALRGSLSGERRSRNLRPALDFSDHRPYTPGDDLRHVDWNAFSRHEELFVKLGEATQSVDLHLLLDSSRSMAWSPADDEGPAAADLASLKWNSARRLAGALGYLGLSGGERLTVTTLTQQLGDSFGPTQGKRRAVPFLTFLSKLDPTPPPTAQSDSGLTQALESYARYHPQGGLLILLSDLLDTAAADNPNPELEALADSLRYFSPPRWQILVLHFLSEQELHPTLEGDFDLRDVETGQSLPFHLDEGVLAQYRLRVRRWCTQLQAVCASRAATYAQVLAEWPFERAVVPYLRQRRVLQ